MMLTFTGDNCITEALISLGPTFVSGRETVVKSRDLHDALSDVFFLSSQHIQQSLKSIVRV